MAGASADPTLEDKRSEAQNVLAQIQQIDAEVGLAAEAYNAATIRLTAIQKEQRANKRMLVFARTNLGRAQKSLEKRLVAMYTSDESDSSTLEVLLTATSIEDLLNRLETVERVSNQDADVLRQVTSFRQAVQKRKSQLAKARSAQEQVVAERAGQKAAIEAKLRQRQELLSSIRAQIEQIQARERARQLQLAREARARLQTQNSVGATDLGEVAAAVLAGNAPPARYGGVVGIAMQYLGTPYQWGGATPGGFDCSGFIMYVYAQIGVSLPHNAAAQYGTGSPVARSELQAGDLVFFNGLGHAGIYIGGNQFIHSPHTGDVVKISSLGDSWYAATYVGARRL